jgi:hypothetical protein
MGGKKGKQVCPTAKTYGRSLYDSKNSLFFPVSSDSQVIDQGAEESMRHI